MKEGEEANNKTYPLQSLKKGRLELPHTTPARAGIQPVCLLKRIHSTLYSNPQKKKKNIFLKYILFLHKICS